MSQIYNRHGPNGFGVPKPSEMCMKTRSTVLMLGCLCALTALVTFLVLVEDVRRDEESRGRTHEAVREVERQLRVPPCAAGSQQKANAGETQAATRQLAKESLPAAAIRLLDDRGYTYPLHLVRRGRPPADLDHLLIVLGSPRYSRVSWLIAELAAHQRGAAAHQAFSRVLDVSRRFVAAGLRARTPAERPAELKYVSVYGCKWGLTAAFLLVARFGDLSMLCEDMKAARAFNTQARQKLTKFSADSVGIGLDIQGNALVMAMREHVIRAETSKTTELAKGEYGEPQRLADQAAALVAGLPCRMTTVYPWDMGVREDTRQTEASKTDELLKAEDGEPQRLADQVAALLARLPRKTPTVCPWNEAITGRNILYLRDRAPVSDLVENIPVYGSFSSALVDQLLALAQKAVSR